MSKRELRLTVPDMTSDHCAGIISSAIGNVGGVQDINTDIVTNRVRVVYVPEETDVQRIRQVVEGAGYQVASVQEPTL